MIDLGINKLYVDPGTYGWTLCQKKMVKDKKTQEMKEVMVNISYHGDLISAVREAWRITQRDRLREKECDLRYAIDAMQEIQDEFIAQMREIEQAERGDGDA